MDDNASENKPKKQICIGILAHVDAGKTTLSEAMLYLSGSIRSLGRVDNRDAFLDTNALERARGITIFSKQARMHFGECSITLLDTPGHVDFSAEMERTLQVLDAAILVINGADGVQGHTVTLWSLLKKNKIPVFLFVNKMDQIGTDKEKLLTQIQSVLSENCIDFSKKNDDFYEQAAMAEETALEQFLESGTLTEETLRELIAGRKLFPCFFGSALKLYGVEEFLKGLEQYTKAPEFPKEFGAKVFKISRDAQGNRLTFLKVTGGVLPVKAMLCGEEKVNQIRLYSGEKYETLTEVHAGEICAVTGPVKTYPGQGIGIEVSSGLPVLMPVLTCTVLLPEGCDAAVMLSKLRELEEEEPMLHIVWKEELQEIQAQIMGEVQIEILKSLIQERFGVAVEFGGGNTIYKETIRQAVVGVGHFEPLKHYAEVHLLLEPLEAGSGLVFATDCSEDILSKNWQRLVLTHLEEKEHKGVLTGAAITDMKITLIAGRAHTKHTEGGDFRQATYRAVRQGLKQAESILLEPYYTFRLEIPKQSIGRAMTDLEKRFGVAELSEQAGETAVLTGTAPAATMQDYQKEVHAYTKGQGRLSLSFKGYYPCHNAEEVIAESGYDSEHDLDNPTGSVFCAHGAGFVVEWDKVRDYMHVDSKMYRESVERAGGNEVWKTDDYREADLGEAITGSKSSSQAERTIGTEEIDRILERTFHANTKEKAGGKGKMPWKRTKETIPSRTVEWKLKEVQKKDAYLLVDGYNVIFAWEELAEISKVSIDGARGRLLDILCDYQAQKGCEVIVVFDAYRIKGHQTEGCDYHNIHVVYTKEAETADRFIEKFAHENGRKYRITVATSDGLEQIIIRGQGCLLLSARELLEEVERTKKALREDYHVSGTI